MKENYLKISLIITLLGFIFLILSLYLPHLFNEIIQKKISQNLQLVNGSAAYLKWSNLKVPLLMKIYLYNITNPDDFLKGKKPVFEEKGPYIFDQTMTRRIHGWEENETLINFEVFKSFKFNPHLTEHSLNDKITVLNFPLLILTKIASDTNKLLTGTLSGVFKSSNEKVFITRTVDELLFTGYKIPVIDKFLKLVKTVKNLSFKERFGFMYGKNDSSNGIWTIKTGKDGMMDYGSVVRWNGKSALDCWSSDECNVLKGTDGSFFHPFIQRDEKLFIFAPDLNRSLFITYKQDSEVEGIQTYKFMVPKETFLAPKKNEMNKCFCVNDDLALTKDGFCSIDGLIDSSRCNRGAPILFSSPHYLYGDKLLVDSLIMTKPSEELHSSYLEIDPVTGLVLSAKRKLQVNLNLRYKYKIGALPPLPDMVYPLIWFEETAKIEPDKAAQLKAKVHDKLIWAQRFATMFITLGFILIVISLFILFWPKISKKLTNKPKMSQDANKNYEYSYSNLSNSVKKNSK